MLVCESFCGELGKPLLGEEGSERTLPLLLPLRTCSALGIALGLGLGSGFGLGLGFGPEYIYTFCIAGRGDEASI